MSTFKKFKKYVIEEVESWGFTKEEIPEIYEELEAAATCSDLRVTLENWGEEMDMDVYMEHFINNVQ